MPSFEELILGERAIRETTMKMQHYARMAQRAAPVIRRVLLPTSQELEVERYWAEGGDQRFRSEYRGVGPESRIMDIGGYLGQWTSDMVARYGCRAQVYEPVRSFAKQIEARFAKNPRVQVNDFGLSDRHGYHTLTVDADCSTVFESRSSHSLGLTAGTVEAFFMDAPWAFDGDDERAVVTINCEGGEYAILPRLIETGTINRIRELEIQFHDFVPGAQEKREAIREKLRETHTEVYCYPFVWEHWRTRR